MWSSVDKLDSKLLTQLDLAISSGSHLDPHPVLDDVTKSRLVATGRGSTYRPSQPSAVQYRYKVTFADAGVVGLSIERGNGRRATPEPHQIQPQPTATAHAEASPERHACTDHRFRTSSRSVPQTDSARERLPIAEVKDSLHILFLFIHPLSRPALVHGPPAPHSRHACPSLASVRFLPACGSANARFEAVRRGVHL